MPRSPVSSTGTARLPWTHESEHHGQQLNKCPRMILSDAKISESDSEKGLKSEQVTTFPCAAGETWGGEGGGDCPGERLAQTPGHKDALFAADGAAGPLRTKAAERGSARPAENQTAGQGANFNSVQTFGFCGTTSLIKGELQVHSTSPALSASRCVRRGHRA